MKTIKIKSLHIQNFGNIKDLSINFGRKTLISGRNEAGKTTINDAYRWLMTNKLANGSQADGIRPHDRSGIEDDNAVISVYAVIEIDGAEKEFLKEQRKEIITCILSMVFRKRKKNTRHTLKKKFLSRIIWNFARMLPRF